MIEPTPWDEMLGVSAHAGVTPAAFWRLSLKEWRALVTAPRTFSPLARAQFDAIAARFPDTTHD